jgi:P-type conjugative transfer protein TrbJ
MKQKWRAGVLAGFFLIAVVAYRSDAIVPVFDEAAFTQMLVEAIWWLEDLAYQAEQVANQVTQIEQGILMLENWALSLKNLDFSAVPIIGGPLAQMLGVFEQAQNAFFNAALIKEKFEELYSPFHAELLSGDAYLAKAFDWNAAVRDAHVVAMQQQATLTMSLDSAMTSM